jgi:hypothetical protein
MTKEAGKFGQKVPEKRFSAGSVSVTIWHNEAKRKDGQTVDYATVTVQRGYKDNEGNWQNANSLRLNDLPKAAMALTKAYEYLTFKDDSTVAE